MTGRIVRSADFERVLGGAAKARSEHFAVHHLPSRPSLPAKPHKKGAELELSTASAPHGVIPVDDSVEMEFEPNREPEQVWLGLVVPKRHAKRSVTRSLFKRQIRAAVGRHAALMVHGLWVVRLRAPFDKAKFPSAASHALQSAARAELDTLLAGAAQRVR